jgi:hypothetical protein
LRIPAIVFVRYISRFRSNMRLLQDPDASLFPKEIRPGPIEVLRSNIRKIMKYAYGKRNQLPWITLKWAIRS